jgi:hypothetical protein
VFTARYALSPYIKQIRFVFKGLIPNINNPQFVTYVRIYIASYVTRKLPILASQDRTCSQGLVKPAVIIPPNVLDSFRQSREIVRVHSKSSLRSYQMARTYCLKYSNSRNAAAKWQTAPTGGYVSWRHFELSTLMSTHPWHRVISVCEEQSLHCPCYDVWFVYMGKGTSARRRYWAPCA